MNHAMFFAGVRSSLFGGALSQSQVDGINAILEAAKASITDSRMLAYMLATALHETDHTMQPIRERGGEAYFTRMYDPKGSRPKVAAALGNVLQGDGALFAGRGYVQLTGRRNYQLFGRLLGLDLLANPDRAMEPEIAGRIMVLGMTGGLFTGKKLSDYFTVKASDWTNARRIINGTDCAALIAGYGRRFHAALEAAA
ncbi:hypothetical protein [Rhizobium paknamense]|uniref:Glycoside hydrolase family 19 catalytic domain-containing protein n=1 Tax=Rhizobium paknamense TaxID=1206817 RepID=A0ABU0ICT9_9HYPH|nr:hypothetical protein [Rhizobium paknamense]MDQ0456057.1 hypothetical protein [Rhizobium paknamense]